MNPVLVAYGSKHGATAGIAEVIADELRRDGLAVEIWPSREVSDPSVYRALVIGGALYLGHWHRDAVDLAERLRREAVELPIWLFSAGPLDSSASSRDLPATASVRDAGRGLNVRGHRTFGGRLLPGAEGLLEQIMIRAGVHGDYRDFHQVRAWAREIAHEVTATLVPA